MTLLRSLFLSPLLSLLLCLPAMAAEDKPAPCTAAQPAWHCPGAIELRDEAKQTAARLSWFSNGELLGERQTGKDVQRYVALKPSLRAFYANVAPMDLGNVADPFRRFDTVFADALAALRAAYAQGPASVPANESQQTVTVEAKPVRLKTWRTSAQGRIEFEYQPEDSPAYRGYWDAARPAPWDDKAAMEGFVDVRGAKAPPTVGEARQPQAKPQ